MSSDESTRPWGSYQILHEHEEFKVKTIWVDPGKRLSYQTHKFRKEFWNIVIGSGEVTLDGDVFPVEAGDTVIVDIGQAHRISNTGSVPLCFVEVQTGTYFGEDDIVRLDDDFGRS